MEEYQTVVELVEGLEEVFSDDARPKQTMRIGTLASRPV